MFVELSARSAGFTAASTNLRGVLTVRPIASFPAYYNVSMSSLLLMERCTVGLVGMVALVGEVVGFLLLGG